ncbi:unnamed protein product [Penicillium bialowiezense]
MASISFSSADSGTQFGINNGTVNVFSHILASLAFPRMLDRRDNVEPYHTNTCQWILELEKFQSWRSEPRGLLWIKGKPGAGKSTLMLFLHKKLGISQKDNQGIQLDFFFTARGTEMQRTPLGMLRSLLNQIFDRDATVRPQVRETYEKRCRQFGSGEGRWEWTQGVLEELLPGVILASASRQQVTVFVDALDETGAESARQLAAYFHRLIDRAAHENAAVRVCISCRHYPIIGSAHTMEIHVEQHNRKDIATYIQDILAETEVEDIFSEDTRQILMEQLIQQANGVFQWARLVMPLARQRIDEGESFDDICSWLHEVPAGLEDVYMYILNDVIEARNLEQSFLLFQWVCLAERPLTVIEMRYALVGTKAQITSASKTWEKIYGFVESDERMKRRIKALSGGLAEVVSSGASDHTVQVVHQSVNDFLRAQGLAALSDIIGASSRVSQRENIIFECQANLYRSCLVYLALLRVSGDISNGSQAVAEHLIRNHPLVAYATINLFIHAEKAARCRVLILPNDYNILQQVISQWVQIYQLLNPYSPACPERRTTVIHMAAAANLVDIIERMSLNSEDVAREDEYGDTPFHLAARHGHITGGRILREKAVDCGATNRKGRTPLIEAASFGRTEFVEWLLLEGVKLEATMGEGASALQEASLGGHQDIVKILLGAGADVNVQGGSYGNALQAAAYGESSEIVRMLLDAGADVNAQGGRYGNALQAAAYRQSSEIVRMLLDAGADVNAQGGDTYGNALQAAAYRESSEIVRMLLDAGADVNAQGGDHGNALQAAATYGESSEIVRMLLDAGADVNAQGGRYGNALQAAAAYRESSEIVRMLLDAGADVNAHGGCYGNVLQAAAAHRESSEIVQMLLDAGADVNAHGGRYGIALQAAAVYKESSEIIRMLDAGADVNIQGGLYGNALQAAAIFRESSEIVRILLDAGADVNAHGGKYGTSLMAAVHQDHADQVQILLHAGADVLLTDELGQTPLHIAASNNRLNLLHRFPEILCPINTQDKLLQTPIHLAIYLGHIDFATNLLHRGANPSLLDGYGRNALDWVLGNESLVHQIQKHYPSIVATPGNTQELAVRQSILQISNTLLQSGPHFSWPLLQQLGRFLLFVSDADNAQFLFRLHLSQNNLIGTPVYEIECDICTQAISGSRFVCRICAHVDLCSSCVHKYPFHSLLHPNQEHETLEVPSEIDQESPLLSSVSEKLKELVDKFSEPNIHRSGNGPAHDSVAYLPSTVTATTKSTAAISMALLGPISMFCLLSFGLIAASFTYWYTLI